MEWNRIWQDMHPGMLKRLKMKTKPLYDLAMRIAARWAGAAASLWPADSLSKTYRFLRGQRNTLEEAKKEIEADPGKKRIWIHSASLGEFAIARPIIDKLRKKGYIEIIVTFFSPSGYEVISKQPEKYPNVYYLPLDSQRNARRFIDCIRPDAAVIMVSEFWHNYLAELAKRHIPTFLVSALIRPGSVFFRWYGGDYRDDLKVFKRIFTLDKRSTELIKKLGVNTATTNGDPLFDNAYANAKREYSNTIIERFKDGKFMFVAGSLNDHNDLELVATVANRHPDLKFLIIPHDVGSRRIESIVRALKGKTKRYSNCSNTTDFSGIQNLVIDYVGELALIYRYGSCAYIGGGFTPYLHSVIEAVVYGLPVSFGPKIHRKVTPRQLIEAGIGEMVSTPDELDQWLSGLIQNREKAAAICKSAEDYINLNVGATETVVNAILEEVNKQTTSQAQ